MGAPKYLWRQLTPKQRQELLAWRKEPGCPWHLPPHRPNFGHLNFLISASCFEHRHYIGKSPERMDQFSVGLLSLISSNTNRLVAWCVLPNHYHALVEVPDILKLLAAIGRFHGSTSFAWNGEEDARGRQVFHRCTERYMRSDRDFFATINYVHNNPVHHGYVQSWTDWQWSSAGEYLQQVGRAEAIRVWKEYPIKNYGSKWDQPDL